jgi:isopropylmalate/homocitrate/citramalate synthase
MTDLPSHVEIHEEGPREGFQIEPGPISSADKIRLIDALSDTGLHHIQVCSFVNPRLVPGWADAEAVAGGFTPKPGVHYTGLYFNGNGLDRALVFKDRLSISGSISLTASVGFTKKNLNRTPEENIAQMKRHAELHIARGIPVTRVGVMAAFGCNYQGDIAPETVVKTLEDGMQIAAETGAQISMFSLADTMGWATPVRIERTIGAVRERWPDMKISPAASPSPTPMRASNSASPASIPLSADWVVAPSPASRKPRATSAPKNSCCCVRRWASTPASIWTN